MKLEATVELAGGKSISFETGRLAKQAHGSTVVRIADNVILATACSNSTPRVGIDFFPLTVDYREYTYAGGRFPGGFIKREGRPSEREILTCRQIDRPIRPLFPEGFRCETQVIALVLSADTENDPDVAAINGACAALEVSDIPFHGPLGAVRVGLVNGAFIINPTYLERKESLLNIMVVGSPDGIVMVESGAAGVAEQTVIDAIEFAHTEIKKICAAISDLAKRVGRPKRKVEPVVIDEAYMKDLRAKIGERLSDALDTKKYPKAESHTRVKAIEEELLAAIPEDDEEASDKLEEYFELLRERIFREQVIEQKRRPDQRAFDEIRQITIEVGALPRTHGSAVFTRGETQALVTCTLGTAEDAQKIESFEGEAWKSFMLHYNFPPFSVGETKFMRGPSRRDIGHGNLARRALAPMLPSEEAFPY
ncbi:MAG TPA: polyribonucleotide nucleotidyltransferase, partial [Terriglobales bacterium]|nr:polyribonucleotide nucleotidyltransferase [Terriglobales bacterium]